MKVNIAKKAKAKVELRQALESRQANINCLEQELAKAKDARSLLEFDLTELERAETSILEQLQIQDKRLAETEQEVTQAQNTSEEVLKADLTTEFEQAYADELLKLEEQIRHYKVYLN